jgi:hypothetical protein
MAPANYGVTAAMIIANQLTHSCFLVKLLPLQLHFPGKHLTMVCRLQHGSTGTNQIVIKKVNSKKKTKDQNIKHDNRRGGHDRGG